MTTTEQDALRRLEQGVGVWIQGAPGSGRSHTLRAIARQWPGAVLWVDDPGADWLPTLPKTVLLCLDDASDGMARADLPENHPVVATGARPGEGWTLIALAPLSEEDSVQLFLQHAPAAGAMSALRGLARRLSGNPTAIIAAARRWPAERLEAILDNPSPGWPGLRDAYDALSESERDALALICRLPGPARREGLIWCGRARGVDGLVTAGWVTVPSPGRYALPAAIAEAVRPWRTGDVAPYFSWFAEEARNRVLSWDEAGGSREWFRSGLWPALAAQPNRRPEPWLFRGWSLSGESAQPLLDALKEHAATLPAMISARCAARAHHTLGERPQARQVLQDAVEAGDTERPRDAALAQMELGVAHHRLRELDAAMEAYESAMPMLTALDLRRGRMLCLANIAAVAHDRGEHEQARAGYQDAVADAAALGQLRPRGIFSSNLGALLVELGELDAARAALQQAVRNLSEEPDDRFLAITRANQAAVELIEGHLDAADTQYQEALALLGDTDPSSAALCHARRGAIAALRDRLDDARRHHERADLTAPPEDPLTIKLIALWRVFLEWQAGDRASALGRRRDSLHGEPSLVSISDDARLVLRLLERLAAQPDEVLLVGPEGAWFRLPGAARVSVERYAAVARILAFLAQEAERQPGTISDADTLITAGWPGEQIVPDAAKNRLAVSLARLRKLGMRELLQRTREGWRLDPDWSVLLLHVDEPAEG
ncbi:MAG: hypothetical protein AAFV53_12930 [Myxococcota bacterium]